MSGPFARPRSGAAAFALAGVLFVLYPALRPWHDESTTDGAIASMSSGAWVAAHLFAMLGFILLPLGLLSVRHVVGTGRAGSSASAAVVTTWIGAGLTLPYFGAEDFALHAIAGKAGAGQNLDVLGLAEAVRFGAVAATTFGLGLVLLAVGAVLTAVAVWRSGVLPRFSGVPYALGFVLFLPQFYTPPAARIGHGVLLGVGLCWLAAALWSSRPTRA
ncbi:hypothetical protein [Micromonospora zhanjiangensis]|uniref:DUF4386 family protein n=1 Tax=Micromonospora zhanjiangensis TaxID=1522057 RepID=A0ABV8KU12_9ACTN